MSSALVGLVGVVIGALLAGVNAYAVERAKARRRARAAGRLLENELWQIAGRAKLLAAELHEHHGDANAWVRDAEAITTLPSPNLWAEHRGALAESLSDKEWQAVADGYRCVDLLRTSAMDPSDWERFRASSFLGSAVWAGSIVGYLVDRVEGGARALARLAGRSPKHAPGDELDRLLGVVSSSGTRYAASDSGEDQEAAAPDPAADG